MSMAVDALGRIIKQVQSRHHRMIDTCLREIGLTLAQWDALRAIDRNPEASSHALAEYTFQSDQSFGALARRMMENGLIRCAGGQGRRISYELTMRGETMLREGEKRASKTLAASFAPLSDEQRVCLFALLEKLVE